MLHKKLFVPVLIALIASLALASGAFAEGPWQEFTLKLGPQTTLTERTIDLASGEGIEFGEITGLTSTQNISITVSSLKGLAFKVQKPGETITTGCTTSDAEICALNLSVDATAKDKSLIVYGAKNQPIFVTFKMAPSFGNVTIKGKQYGAPKLAPVVDYKVDVSGTTLALDVFPIPGDTLQNGDKILIRATDAVSVFASKNLFKVGDEVAHLNTNMSMYFVRIEWSPTAVPLLVQASGPVVSYHSAAAPTTAEYAVIRAPK